MTALIIQESMEDSGRLTFKLVQNQYQIEALKFKEIIGMSKIKSVPRTSGPFKGIIGLHGKIIPFYTGEEFTNHKGLFKIPRSNKKLF
jgi:chemotaxis signal transduction protein